MNLRSALGFFLTRLPILARLLEGVSSSSSLLYASIDRRGSERLRLLRFVVGLQHRQHQISDVDLQLFYIH